MFRPVLSRLIASCLLTACLLAPAGAQDSGGGTRAVVELFTSQGCSSCPPADALLTDLAERSDVVALAYHVDYWDYIGWEDTFGAKGFSDRQRDYAKSWGSSRIFTPQMVINGAKGVVGSKRNLVQSEVANAHLPVAVAVSRTDNVLNVTVPGLEGQGDATVWLVTYIDEAHVAIERGENAGKTMIYTHVVTGRQLLGAWEAEDGASFKLPLQQVLSQPGSGLAILVQQDRQNLPGTIIGAAAYEP